MKILTNIYEFSRLNNFSYIVIFNMTEAAKLKANGEATLEEIQFLNKNYVYHLYTFFLKRDLDFKTDISVTNNVTTISFNDVVLDKKLALKIWRKIISNLDDTQTAVLEFIFNNYIDSKVLENKIIDSLIKNNEIQFIIPTDNKDAEFMYQIYATDEYKEQQSNKGRLSLIQEVMKSYNRLLKREKLVDIFSLINENDVLKYDNPIIDIENDNTNFLKLIINTKKEINNDTDIKLNELLNKLANKV